MASRQEEKERRRQERLAEEQKAAAAAARTRRLQIVGGAVLAIAVVVVVVVLVAGGGGGGNGGDDGPSASTANTNVVLPERKITDLDAAAKAANCKLVNPPDQGRDHTSDPVEYGSNPPTSGPHNPTPAQDGIYDPGNSPAPENTVHTLEHGRIIFQYRKGAPQRTRDTLEAIFNEPVNGTPGYHAVVMENNTNMPYAVAATAWTHIIGCPSLNDKTIDALRAFRERYTDKAPEFIP